MKMKKLLSVLMATAMTAGMLMGCGNTADNNTTEGTNSTADAGSSGSTEGGDLSTDTSEHVDLKMYLIGTVQRILMRFMTKSIRFWKRS